MLQNKYQQLAEVLGIQLGQKEFADPVLDGAHQVPLTQPGQVSMDQSSIDSLINPQMNYHGMVESVPQDVYNQRSIPGPGTDNLVLLRAWKEAGLPKESGGLTRPKGNIGQRRVKRRAQAKKPAIKRQQPRPSAANRNMALAVLNERNYDENGNFIVPRGLRKNRSK